MRDTWIDELLVRIGLVLSVDFRIDFNTPIPYNMLSFDQRGNGTHLSVEQRFYQYHILFSGVDRKFD